MAALRLQLELTYLHTTYVAALRVQLELVQNREIFLRVPFLTACDTRQISTLVSHMTTEFAWPGSPVLTEGEVGRGLFLIIRGFFKVSNSVTKW